jgi:hypothetical protein
MAETGARDVQNHVLFEVATEVANRGGLYYYSQAISKQMLTECSRWYLLSPQVQGASNDGRVWRRIHTFGSLEQGLGRRIAAAIKNDC